jgi:hypothetical protein
MLTLGKSINQLKQFYVMNSAIDCITRKPDQPNFSSIQRAFVFRVKRQNQTDRLQFNRRLPVTVVSTRPIPGIPLWLSLESKDAQLSQFTSNQARTAGFNWLALARCSPEPLV